MNLVNRVKRSVLRKFFPEVVEEVQRLVRLIDVGTTYGEYIVSRSQIQDALQENGYATTQALAQLNKEGYQLLSGANPNSKINRAKAIRTSQVLALHNAQIKRALDIWTSFGLGTDLNLKVENNPQADSWLQDFVKAERNKHIFQASNLIDISHRALHEGEVFVPLFFSPIDGVATADLYRTSDIGVIWHNPTTMSRPIALNVPMRNSWLTFPLWNVSQAQLSNIEVPTGYQRTDQGIDARMVFNVPNTIALAVWKTRNRHDGRGLPQFLQAANWAITVQNFAADRASIARAAASFGDKITADTGSRGIRGIANNQGIDSLAVGNSVGVNRRMYPQEAGATWIQNQKIDRQWMVRDTAGKSAEADGRVLLGLLSVGLGYGQHWAGDPGALANRSTAEEIAKPFVEMMNSYQNWLSELFIDISRAVIYIGGEYGTLNSVPLDNIHQIEVRASLETPLNVMLETVYSVFEKIMWAVRTGTVDKLTGTIAINEVLHIILQKLNVADARRKIYDPEYQQEIVANLNSVALEQMDAYLEAWKQKPDLDKVGFEGEP